MSESTMTGTPAGPSGSATAAGREPGPLQAGILLVASCMSVLGAVLLAPALPRMQDAFAAVAGAAVLVPITLTVPALMIGLLAPFAGRIVDAAGRKRLLVIALLAYAVFGTAPLYLGSLQLIVASRVGVGIAEAAIMTCCTTLLADYYSGPKRDRMFALQVIVTSMSATLFFAVGGALGSSNWRTPFWLYTSSLLLAVLVARYIWNPAPRGQAAGAKAALPPLDWRPLVLPCAVTFVGGISFYLLIVELSYKLDDIGITSTATIGAASALASVATSAGSFVFGRSGGRSVRSLLTTAFVLLGVGQLVVAAAQAVPLVLVGAIVAGAGGGLLLPTMLTWTLAGLSYAQRGRGTGLWTASIFLGEFVCPVIVVALGAAIAGLASAIAVVGVVSLLMAALVGTRMVSPQPARGQLQGSEPEPSVAA